MPRNECKPCLKAGHTKWRAEADETENYVYALALS
jgi:hypothetical protein